MSYTLELLRMESERQFWPLNRPIVSPHGCPNAKSRKNSNSALANENANNNNTIQHNHHHHHHHQRENGNCAKLLAGLSSHTPHSYYECCINVHVSSLLEHWLDWDCPSAKSSSKSCSSVMDEAAAAAAASMPNDKHAIDVDRLVSYLAESEDSSTDPTPWVRQFCKDVGCDVLNRQDSNGRTLLHHLLSGSIRRNLASTVQVLLESGAKCDMRDQLGNTALSLVRNMLDSSSTSEAVSLIRLFVLDHNCDVNMRDNKGRTLLSYSVASGDSCVEVTRLLLNCGAQVWPPVDQLTEEFEASAFTGYLRSQMKKPLNCDLDEQTLYLLCTAMASEATRMRGHVDRCMVQLGISKRVHGPLFQRIRGLMTPYWARPAQLRQLCVRTVRKSIGPKRLARGEANTLRLPKKLQKFVTLEERVDHKETEMVMEEKEDRSFEATYHAYVAKNN